MAERKKKRPSAAGKAGKAPAKKAPKKSAAGAKKKNIVSGTIKKLRGSQLTKPTVKKPSAGKKIAAKKPARGKDIKTAAAKKIIGAKTGKKTEVLHELKKSLMHKRETIVKEAKEEIAKYISGENRQLVDTALDEGDWAVVDISEDINLMRLAAHRRALHDIDEAIRKIEEGSYGQCEECGEEIGEKRLDVLPTATLCVSCQGTKEQLEAIEKVEPQQG